MSRPDPFYALGKFADAVYTLATSPGDVKERLQQAFLFLLPVRVDDLPPALRANHKWVMDTLTKKHDPYGSANGDLLATLKGMHKTTGVAIAKRIVDLEARLRGALYIEHRRHLQGQRRVKATRGKQQG